MGGLHIQGAIYPAWPELRRYFEHVDKKWNVSAHTTFHKCVETATFDTKKSQWLIECTDESQYWCKWFIPNLGFALKNYSPPFPDINNFKGEVYHTAKWPQHDVYLKEARRCGRYRRLGHSDDPGARSKDRGAYGLPAHTQHVPPNEPKEARPSGRREEEAGRYLRKAHQRHTQHIRRVHIRLHRQEDLRRQP